MTISPVYAGRLLRVDLSTGRIGHIDTERYAPRFLGGRGVATALIWDEVPRDARFDDDENRVVIAVGPLAGAPGGLGGSRWGIYARSPFPRADHGGRDHFCYGNLGGRFGAELRFAGWDGVVISGRAETPVWLEIVDDRVTLHRADELWGSTTVAAMAGALGRTAPRAKALAIGPAGEHLVPLATVFADGDASCGGGMGAVLGAKRLKAITVRGTRRQVEVADRARLKAIERTIRGYRRGNVKVWGLDFMAHGPKTRKAPCFGCMGHCLRVRYRADDGTSGKFMCQSRFFYMNHAWGWYGEDNDVPFYANRLCDEQGIDTWEVQALIEWLLRGRLEGVLSEAETGLDLETVGSLEFIQALVGRTARREGFGEVLALGARGAARAVGGAAAGLALRNDPYDPRYCTVNTLLFPFETREPIQQLHEAGLVLSQWSSWAKGVEEAHVTSETVRGIAERFWGSPEAADMTTLDGKARAAKRIQERQLAKECLGVCDWMFPLIDVPNGDDPVGDPTFENRILSAVLGREVEEEDLRLVGERVFNLQRALLVREGHRPIADDVLPEEWIDTPVETHVADPDLLAPGPGGAVSSQLGRTITRDEFERVRDEYYELRGWDVPTGMLSREHLARLGLDDVALDLLRRGLAVPTARPRSLARRVTAEWGRLRRRLEARLADRRAASAGSSGESLDADALLAVLETERGKFGLPEVRRNFSGWNKTMQYTFPDIGEHWAITFVNGEAGPPKKLDVPLSRPDIAYEMDTAVLAAMSAGELSGEEAYLTRKLRIKASFSDMMKLQSLNKV